jgi:hypothetical protein
MVADSEDTKAVLDAFKGQAARKLTDWNEAPEVMASSQAQVQKELDSLPHHPIRVTSSGRMIAPYNDNPPGSPRLYVATAPNGDEYLVNTEGYDYPRYVSKLHPPEWKKKISKMKYDEIKVTLNGLAEVYNGGFEQLFNHSDTPAEDARAVGRHLQELGHEEQAVAFFNAARIFEEASKRDKYNIHGNQKNQLYESEIEKMQLGDDEIYMDDSLKPKYQAMLERSLSQEKAMEALDRSSTDNENPIEIVADAKLEEEYFDITDKELRDRINQMEDEITDDDGMQSPGLKLALADEKEQMEDELERRRHEKGRGKARSSTSGWTKLKKELPSSAAAQQRISEGVHTPAYHKVLEELKRYWEKRGR